MRRWLGPSGTPSSAASQPWIPWGLKEVRPGQVTTAKDQGRRRHGLALALALQPGPQGAVLRRRRGTQAHRIPFPHASFLSLARGGGPHIVLLSGSDEQTEKRLPGAAWAAHGPSSVSPGADGTGHPQAFLPLLPWGDAGVLPSARLL